MLQIELRKHQSQAAASLPLPAKLRLQRHQSLLKKAHCFLATPSHPLKGQAHKWLPLAVPANRWYPHISMEQPFGLSTNSSTPVYHLWRITSKAFSSSGVPPRNIYLACQCGSLGWSTRFWIGFHQTCVENDWLRWRNLSSRTTFWRTLNLELEISTELYWNMWLNFWKASIQRINMRISSSNISMVYFSVYIF